MIEVADESISSWKQAARERLSDSEAWSDDQLMEALLAEFDRLAAENKRLKQALFKAATTGKPAMSTKLSEALRE